MDIREQIDLQLERLAADGNHGPGDRRVVVRTEAGLVQCDLVQVNELACAIDRLILHTEALADASNDSLRKLSERLAGRLTYLLESLRLVELDEDARVVQMRSDPPQRDASGASYYELVANRRGLELRRYAKQRGEPRRAKPANVTREMLYRLCGDFADAVAPPVAGARR